MEQDFDIFEVCGDIKADELALRVMQWLDKNQNNNFFLWVHFREPHVPYDLPPPYNNIYLNDNYNNTNKNVPIVKLGLFGFGGIPEFLAHGKITNIDYYIAQYDGGIKFTDSQIGILLRKLRELKLDKKTLIILTADHGEFLGEHDYYFCHAGLLYDELIRVPLIIRFNKLVSKNKVIDNQVQLINIAPTVLDILGIPGKDNMEGVSLLSLITGKSNYSDLFAFTDCYDSLKSIRTKEWKLIYIKKDKIMKVIEETFPKTASYIRKNSYVREKIDAYSKKFGAFKWGKDVYYLLFNLRNDSNETRNLVKIEKEKFEFLKEKLEDWVNQSNLKNIKSKIILDEETKKKLKSLGYIQ